MRAYDDRRALDAAARLLGDTLAKALAAAPHAQGYRKALVLRLRAQGKIAEAEALLRESTILEPHERRRSGPWTPSHGGHPSHEEKER